MDRQKQYKRQNEYNKQNYKRITINLPRLEYDEVAQAAEELKVSTPQYAKLALFEKIRRSKDV